MKKLSTLHILNGDASLPAFTAAGLPGQVLVWREVLSEGPVVAGIPEEEFWLQRQAFITTGYGATPLSYQQKVLQELPKLDAAGSFFEVVLWFDDDLMCQLNLLYLLHRLHERPPQRITVCTPAAARQVGRLAAAEVQQLFEQRQAVNAMELQQASKIWKLYAGPNPLQLQRYLEQHTFTLPHLQRALRLHLSRFPGCSNGLSQPEQALLHLLQSAPATSAELVMRFMQEQPLYGFGDAQLFQLLQDLQPALVTKSEPLTLTETGKLVLAGKQRFTPPPRWLGGVFVDSSSNYCFDAEQDKLKTR